MSTDVSASAIQASVYHLSVGLLSGSVIEAIVPAFDASASVSKLAFEVFVQIGLNGLVISSLGKHLLETDQSTFGIPFSVGLMESQPGLNQRVASLAAVGRQMALQSSQRMRGQVLAVASPNQSTMP
jgi:hypothetical protein